MAAVQIADLVIPARYGQYIQQLTEEKVNVLNSGMIVRDRSIDEKLAGGGLTFTVPSFKDITNDAENVSSDDPNTSATPKKIGSASEVSVRLSRNQSWSGMDLAADLAGADPMASIASRISYYWARRFQIAGIATLQGVFADNAAAPSGSEHVQNDLTYNVSGSSYSAGVTDFSAEAFIDAIALMGDSVSDLRIMMVHSVVMARLRKNNLIDFIPDSEGKLTIPTFQGLRLVEDDAMPNPSGVTNVTNTASGIYHTWIMGEGVLRLGMGAPKVPFEKDRIILAGNGGGQDVVVSRQELCLHPTGHAYVGSSPNGGPANDNGSNNLAAAGSWQRRYTERKQIKLVRLITREA